MKKVTAVLIQWKRQHNLPMIIQSLTKYPFIDEILIRDNSKCENIKCYGRYTLAKKAKNNIIYTQDDDCVVNNIDQIYEAFIRDQERMATGTIKGFLDVVDDYTYSSKQLGLMGWGTFFKKDWVRVLDKYVDKYGKDECFYRETDRIFSILLGKHHNLVNADLEQFIDKDKSVALCEQPDHLDFKKLAIQRSLEL